MKCELPDFQAGFRKDRETRNQIANMLWIIKKARAFQKNIYFCFIDYVKAFDCVDHNKLWKIIKRWEYQTTWLASWEIYLPWNDGTTVETVETVTYAIIIIINIIFGSKITADGDSS